jgi:hypothetical protein
MAARTLSLLKCLRRSWCMVARKLLIFTLGVARMRPLHFSVCRSLDHKRKPLLGNIGSALEVSGE